MNNAVSKAAQEDAVTEVASVTPVEEADDHQRRGSGRYIVGLALSAGLAGLLYGYDTVSISGAIDFLQEKYALSPALQGLVISSIMIGGVIGAGFSGFLSDKYGRRKILMFGGAFFFVAALWSAFTFSPFTLILARIIGGVGIGLAAALAVTYITESAPTNIRGALTSAYQLLTISGIFLTNVINYFIASSGSHEWGVASGWRWMLGIGAIPAAIFVAALWLSPESPRFLVQAGRVEEGYKVLERISGSDKARRDVEEIQLQIAEEKKANASFSDLFKPGLRKALLIGIFLAIFNQAIGMNAISYYGPVMFSHMGFGGNTEFLASSLVGGIELVFTVVGMYLIDTAGRKKLMAVGSGLMVLFALGISFSYANNYQLLMLIFVMCFTSAFAFSMGPIPWIMIPELFPTYLRGRATGICTVFLWGTNWAIGQFTPMLINSIGGMGTFLVFACTNLLCFLGVVTFVPETKDKTLEEIAELWKPKAEQQSNAQMEVVRATADLKQAEADIKVAEAELARARRAKERAIATKAAAEALVAAQKAR